MEGVSVGWGVGMNTMPEMPSCLEVVGESTHPTST